MICAEFDRTKSAAVSGVYQYDTGQRLMMRGLPSPAELAGEDELLSGDLVTVQAQFSYAGDSQAEMRLAIWDEEKQAWMASVPDEYMTRSKDVHVYVYLYYGADAAGERAETAYEATFRPIGRPAPSGVVTESQLAQWTALKAEIEIALTRVETAASGAQEAAIGAAETAQTARQAAQQTRRAAEETQTERSGLVEAGCTAVRQTAVSGLNAGAAATASLSGGMLRIGAPRGASGAKGETGDTGPSDVQFSFDASTGTLTIET